MTCGIITGMKTKKILLAGLLALCSVSAFAAIRAVTPTAWNGDPNCWQMKRHYEKMATVTNGGAKVVFIGDSITHYWDDTGKGVWAKYFASGARKALNLGTSADRTEHVLWRITEGGELDYVCSWDGEWLGEEYPELEFARNTDDGYADWSTALPTAAGSYAMRMSLNGLITDYQTFTIFPAQQDDPAQLILPSDLVRIEEEAFAGSQVVSVVCPVGLLSIGSRAFAGCETLRLIVIPGSVTEIAGDAFEGASGFTISGEAGSRAEEVAGEIGVPFEAFAE